MSNYVTRVNISQVNDGQHDASVSFVDGHGVSKVFDTFEEANDWTNQEISDYEAKMKQHEQLGTPTPADELESEKPVANQDDQDDPDDSEDNTAPAEPVSTDPAGAKPDPASADKVAEDQAQSQNPTNRN